MNLSRKLRVVLVLVVTAASVIVTTSGLSVEVKSAADGVLTLAAAFGIVPLHLDVVE